MPVAHTYFPRSLGFKHFKSAFRLLVPKVDGLVFLKKKKIIAFMRPDVTILSPVSGILCTCPSQRHLNRLASCDYYRLPTQSFLLYKWSNLKGSWGHADTETPLGPIRVDIFGPILGQSHSE